MGIVSPSLPNVTRIPVGGPAPYNTLVCVTMNLPLDQSGFVLPSDGSASRYVRRYNSGFALAGFDQRAAPPFKHSTTAALALVGPAPANSFIYAVDSIYTAGFDLVSGGWYVELALAVAASKVLSDICDGTGTCYTQIVAQITSWILCYEPPLAPNQPVGTLPEHRFMTTSRRRPYDIARYAKRP